MEEYRISGEWKDTNGIITDFTFHSVTANGVTRGTKKSKAQAIKWQQCY